ncbi:MAG: DegT/DnrJ/EryC1/StrS family aminotransferase [Leptospirales bacterium]
MFKKKLPRGIIYHTIGQSILYFFQSIFFPIKNRKIILRFEQAFASYLNRRYCIAFPFARTATYFVLKSLNLPKGSEVILPPITIKGILDVILDLGLTPIYVDLDLNTVNFEINELSIKISSKTRVAIITPLFGLVPNITEIIALLRKHNIFIIEDFSQCLNGSFRGKKIGTFGDIGIYSASSIKTLDTLGGGLVIMDDKFLFEKVKSFQESLFPPRRRFLIKKAWINLVRNVATSQPIFTLFTFPFLQMVRVYDPNISLRQTGQRDKRRIDKLPIIWFHQYTSVQAKIGLAHLAKIDEKDTARIKNAEYIKKNCNIKHFPNTTDDSRNVYWQLIALASNAFNAQVVLAKDGIDIATSSLELISALEDYPNRSFMKNAEYIYNNGVFIPCFPHLSRMDLERIIVSLKNFYQGSNDVS